MGLFPLLLGVVVVLSLPASEALSTEELTLQKVFADLIIRLKKWIHDNEAELRKGMGAIRKHLAQWGMGLRPPSLTKQHKWRPEKTSNNIRPKLVPVMSEKSKPSYRSTYKPRPKPTYKPRPKPTYRPKPNPSQKPRPKFPKSQVPRWNPSKRRLSKSPYDPEYFRSHRRVGRSVVPLDDFQRDYLMVQCLEILDHFYAVAQSVIPTNRRSSASKREAMLELKKRELDKMTTEELKSLLKKLEESQSTYSINKDAGTITINGKESSLENLPDICCTFG